MHIDLSTSESVAVQCPLCRRGFDALRWLIVDLDNRPSLGVHVRDGSLQRTYCPRCIGPGVDVGGGFLICGRARGSLGYAAFVPWGGEDQSAENTAAELARLVQRLEQLLRARGATDVPVNMGGTLLTRPHDAVRAMDDRFPHFRQHFDPGAMEGLQAMLGAASYARVPVLRSCPDLARPNMRELLACMAKDLQGQPSLPAIERAASFIRMAVERGVSAAADALWPLEWPQALKVALWHAQMRDRQMDEQIAAYMRKKDAFEAPREATIAIEQALYFLPQALSRIGKSPKDLGFTPVDPGGPHFFYLMDLEDMFSHEAPLSCADGSPFRAAVGFFESEREQAVCRFDPSGVHVIRISTGLLRRILLVAKLVFDKELITSDQQARREDFWNAPEVQTAGTKLTAALMDRSPVPAAEAQAIVDTFPGNGDGPFDSTFLLFHDMLRFACLHELGHAVLGHARFVSQQQRLFELRELGEPGQPNLDTVLQQVLELEADLFAVRIGFSQAILERELVRLEVQLQGGLEDRLAWLRIACGVMTVLWTSIDGPLAPESASHPPAALRYLNMGTMIDTLGFALGLNFTMIGVQASSYLDLVNYACPPFWDVQVSDASFIDSPVVQKARLYQRKLLEAARPVRDQVDEVAYGGTHPLTGRVSFDPFHYTFMKSERMNAALEAQERVAQRTGGGNRGIES